MAQPTIQTSFASGEWAPKLRSRVDIQKYRSGAALLRNFYVDFSGGGASTRQGTRYVAQVGANGARLIPFQASTTVSYVLEFGQNYIRFYTNGAQVLSGGLPYQVATPYNAADLFPNPQSQNPGLKFVQDVTSLIICHPSYPPAVLTINSANSWTFTLINFGSTIPTPTGLAISTTIPNTGTFAYGYLITAVDQNGQESAPTTPATLTDSYAYLGDQTNPGTNSLTWNAVAGAVSYNVYKTAPTSRVTIAAGAEYGFVSNVTELTYTDATPGATPDFSQTPPVPQNPFQGAGVASYTVTANGSYTVVPGVTVAAAPSGGYNATAIASLGALTATYVSGAPVQVGALYTFPNGVVLKGGAASTFTIVSAGSITGPGTAVPSNPVLSLGGGTGAVNVNFTWGVTALFPISAGAGYTAAPGVTFSAGAAAATAVLNTATGGNPGVPGFIQERLVLAGLINAVQTFNLSQPVSFFNFNTSDPSQDDDAIQGTIISEELNDIRWAVPVPTGILFGTGKSAWLVNGGGGISTMNPITPSNVTAQPQAFNGANDLRPLKIGMDVLYGTNKGNYVRDLTYNLYAQIFTGADISVMSNHLFFGYYMLDWCWAEEPFKTMWAIRNDGNLISLGYVKEQDLIGFAHHDTNGEWLSVCSVIETINGNVVDAVYLIAQRFVNGSFVQYVERMADRYFPFGYEDSWSVDCGLQTAAAVTLTGGALFVAGNSTTVGAPLILLDGINLPFTSGMVGWVVRAGGGIYEITGYTSPSQVVAQVVRAPTFINPYATGTFPSEYIAQPVTTGYTIWEPVTTVTGLTQLIGLPVVGVADGVAIGPLTVSGGGTVALPQAASKVTLGLAYLPQLQTLPLDLGEPTVQGKRKKITGVTLRVADTLGISIGKTFANVVQMKDFTLGNIPTTSTGVASVSDLVNGDGRTIIDQEWDEAGNYCIQQSLPYPATILGAMPEVTVGDTKG